MPLFFFDVLDDGNSVADEWGIELSDIHEAARQAQSLIVDIGRERLPSGGRRDICVKVKCEGRPCFSATLTVRG